MSHELLRERVTDYSQHEKYQLVMKNLPEWCRRKVQASEKKSRRHSFWICFSGMTANKKQIKELIEALLPNGGKITTMRILSNSAELEDRQQEHHHALLRVHGRTC